MIVKSTKESINLKIGKLTVKVGPLTRLQKIQSQSMIAKGQLNNDIEMILMGTGLVLKYALKDIAGLKKEDGSDYILDKDENGYVTEEVMDDLMNADFGETLSVVALNLLEKIPSEFTDPETGEKLKGVKIIEKGSSSKK